jgi:superoxide reductase
MRIPSILLTGLLAAAPVMAPGAVFAEAFGNLQTKQNAPHTPVITAPAVVAAGEPFQVTVTIGKKPHPSDPSHFIRYIALFAGEVELARTTLTPSLTRPTVTYTLTLNKDTTLKALAAPNHSAAWVSELAIKVTH